MTSTVSPAGGQRYAAAFEAFQAGAPAQAMAHLQPLLQAEPRFAAAHHLLGLCLAELGDAAGAERALRQAISLDKRQPASHAALGDLMAALDRPGDAERAYRAALVLDRRHPAAAIGLSRLLGRLGRPAEAVQVTTPIVAAENPPPAALEAHTKALLAVGRIEEALASSRRAADAGVADADIGTAQLLTRLGRFDEAQAAYDEILGRQPDDERAQRGLARAVFARSRDVDAAQAVIDEALTRRWSADHMAFKAGLLNQAGRSPEAYGLLEDAVKRAPNNAMLQGAAAKAAALSDRFDAALSHAEQAARLAPGAETQALVAEASLGAGRPDRAAALLEPLRRARPLDQRLIALTATALRLAGDERYRTLYDYDRFVRAYTIETPKGWPSLGAFLDDLKASLNVLHDGLDEPLDQSLRQGTQTNVNLVHSKDPLVKALFAAMDRPVADYLARLGRSEDSLFEPLRARNTGAHAYNGAWSVRLEPGGGRHVNHIHPEGWLSSAFYVDLPDVIRGPDREGWIQFGQPGLPTQPQLEAEHHVRPEPGRLVLFPSYMWHGTMPFTGDERRLTFAFDVVPGPSPRR